MPKQTLILIRHGVDLPDGEARYKDNMDYPLSLPATPKNTIHIDETRLTKKKFDGKPIGVDQAENLGKHLLKWMQDNDMSPVGKVITQDPKNGEDSSTPNPFNTIYPAVDPRVDHKVPKQNISWQFFGDVKQILDGDNGVRKNPQKALFDNTANSTLVCMTCQSMWGDTNGDHGDHYPRASRLMGVIAGAHDDQTDQYKQYKDILKPKPQKGRTIYVFQDLIPGTCRFATLKQYTLHHDGIR